MVRLIGVIIIIVSSILLALSIVMVFDAHHMAVFLSEVSAAFNKPLDQLDWEKHWRVSSYLMFLFSSVILIAGIGVIQRRRFALALLGGTLLLSLVLDLILRVAGYTKYAFEHTGAMEAAITSIIAVSCLIAFAFGHPKQHEKPSNA